MKTSGAYPIGASRDPEAPFNRPDYLGTFCHECGENVEAAKSNKTEFGGCAEHYEYSPAEIQAEIFEEVKWQRDELMKKWAEKEAEVSRLKAANLALFNKKERLESRLRYKETALDEAISLIQKYSDALYEALESMKGLRG